jgi:adenosylhomocysteine nucleosidase
MDDGRAMKLLAVASDRMEFRGILEHSREGAPLRAPVDWARRVRMGSHEFLLMANGAGVKRAAAAAEQGVEAFRPDAIASIGYCGALDPALALADIVVGTEVTGAGSRYAAHSVQSSRRHTCGVVRTHSRVAQTLQERCELRSEGAVAVDMEAAAVAQCGTIHALPFYCVKVVTDLANEPMANDFNKALREDGHFDTINLLTGMLRSPFARLPELVRLRGRAIRAALALGDFFADCRF